MLLVRLERPEEVEVPDVVGLARESARGHARRAGLGVHGPEQESDRTRAGARAGPRGRDRVDKGSRDAHGGQGARDREVPSVIGATRTRRERALRTRASTATCASAETPTRRGRHRPRAEPERRGATGRARRVRSSSGVPSRGPAAGRGDARHHDRGGAMRVAVLAGGRSSEHDVSLGVGRGGRRGARARPGTR